MSGINEVEIGSRFTPGPYSTGTRVRLSVPLRDIEVCIDSRMRYCSCACTRGGESM